MDSGAVLDALLERHRAFTASAPRHTALDKTHRRRSSTATAAPPPKIVEAVERGGNPYILGVQAHAVESAARERAKVKRRAAAVAGTRGPTASKGQETARATDTRTAGPAFEARTAPSASPAVPSAKATQQARDLVVSATLSSRHEELRARRLQEEQEEGRKRHRTGSEGGSSAALAERADAQQRHERAGGAMRKRARLDDAAPRGTRREVWRRRCTTRKTCRLTRGVTRAAGLRRYWYTALRGVRTAATQPPSQGSSGDTEEAALTPAPFRTQQRLESVLGTADAMQRRCGLRRMRATRRGLRGALPPTTAEGQPKKRGPTAGGQPAHEKAARAEDGANEAVAVHAAPSALPISDTRNEKALVRSSRRARQSRIRGALSAAATVMWGVAARVLAERRTSTAKLRTACAPPQSAGMAAAAADVTGPRSGVLPLTLARHFPLFGALVEVHELELTSRKTRHVRSTRHTRRARYAAAIADGPGGTAAGPQVRVRQRHDGMVLEEYSESVGVLLLSHAEQVQALSCFPLDSTASDSSTLAARLTSAPCVVRVPKHFPGASGSFAELLQLMLCAAAPPSTPAAATSNVRVLACVFAGEVGESMRDEAAGAAAYPLHRLLHRCL